MPSPSWTRDNLLKYQTGFISEKHDSSFIERQKIFLTFHAQHTSHLFFWRHQLFSQYSWHRAVCHNSNMLLCPTSHLMVCFWYTLWFKTKRCDMILDGLWRNGLFRKGNSHKPPETRHRWYYEAFQCWESQTGTLCLKALRQQPIGFRSDFSFKIL